MKSVIAEHPLTVGDLRRVIKSLPNDTKVVSDMINSPEEYKAGIVSVEAGIPKNWRGVQGVESGLWFHLRITPMDG